MLVLPFMNASSIRLSRNSSRALRNSRERSTRRDFLLLDVVNLRTVERLDRRLRIKQIKGGELPPSSQNRA